MNIDFPYYRERALIELRFLGLQSLAILQTCLKLWWGALFVLVYILLEQVFDAPSLFTLRAETWQYYKGIMTLLMLAWLFLFTSHVLTRQEYVTGDEAALEMSNGNANWRSIVIALVVTLIFWLLGTPRLAMVILGPLQAIPFFLGEDYQEQASNELPRLINLTLVALAFWILVFQ